MSMLDRLKAAAQNGGKVPGGFRTALALAAVAWGTTTANSIVGDALDRREALEGDLLALNQAIAEARKEFDRVNIGAEHIGAEPLLLDHNHSKIAEAIASGRFDQSVRERANVLAAPYPVPFPETDNELVEFADLNTTADVPHRLLGVDEPVPGSEASTSDGD